MSPRHRPRSRPLRTGRGLPVIHHQQPSSAHCPSCLGLQVRWLVVLHTAYDVTMRVPERDLRLRVFEHLTVCWWECCLRGGHPGSLDGFFLDYCRDVQRDLDPQAPDRDWELRRVWTNHASLLGGDLDEVCPRPDPPG